ncbi:unnamed protein product [Gadus morhua 'NCC']
MQKEEEEEATSSMEDLKVLQQAQCCLPFFKFRPIFHNHTVVVVAMFGGRKRGTSSQHGVCHVCGWVLALPGRVDDPQSCVSVAQGESPQVQRLLHNGAVLQQRQAHSAVNSLM